MSVNEIIYSTLSAFGDPVAAGEYVSQPHVADPERYYTFSVTTYGADYSDDEPGHEIAFVQVCFICPRTYDSVERVNATKQALAAIEDMTWPNVMPDPSSDGQRIVFECKYLKGVLD